MFRNVLIELTAHHTVGEHQFRAGHVHSMPIEHAIAARDAGKGDAPGAIDDDDDLAATAADAGGEGDAAE